MRAGYGASTIPFPDNRYAFNYPVKQNYNGTAANGFQAQGSMAAGFPSPALLDIPENGIVPIAGTSLQNATLDVIPTGLKEATLQSWNVAYQRQLPFLLSADIAYVGNRGDDLVMDVDRNASLVYNSGNDGRPQFAPFNRTGTSRARTQSRQVEVSRPADEDRSPLQARPDDHQLVHAQPIDGTTSNENTTIGTPIDFQNELGPVELRSHAQLRADDHLRLAARSRPSLAERRPRPQDPRRLAGEHAVRRRSRARR